MELAMFGDASVDVAHVDSIVERHIAGAFADSLSVIERTINDNTALIRLADNALMANSSPSSTDLFLPIALAGFWPPREPMPVPSPPPVPHEPLLALVDRNSLVRNDESEHFALQLQTFALTHIHNQPANFAASALEPITRSDLSSGVRPGSSSATRFVEIASDKGNLWVDAIVFQSAESTISTAVTRYELRTGLG